MKTFSDFEFIDDDLKMYNYTLSLLPSQLFFAKQMEEPFEIIREDGNCTKGKSGDYVVQDFNNKISIHNSDNFHKMFKEFK